MSFFSLALLLLAAASRVVLDDTIQIPRGEWRYIDMAINQPLAIINCEYQVLAGYPPVRVVWIARRNLESFRAGHPENILAATQFGMDGKLRHIAPEAGDYAMVLENQPASRARGKVKVRVWLESPLIPRVLSPQRRLAVILISAIVFCAIVSFSALKLKSQIGRC